MEELERKPKGNLHRKLKRRERAGLYNVLRSIYEDSLFVRELREDILPGIPVLANLRCGAWYSPRFDGDCYFKSTDGHCGKWQFSFTRLNAHVARTAAGAGGALLVDSTKSAVKRFPDSFARTVPIWCGVLNRAVAIARGEGDDRDWDREVHLPSWIPDSERSALEPLVEGWSQKLAKTQPGLLEELSEILAKPLRPLWVSDDSPMWQHVTREDRDGFSFVPVYLLCCSKLGESPRTSADKFTRHSWRYIRGAADDHEAWAAGLTPQMFWSHHEELLETDPEEVERTVEEIASREGLRYGAGFGGKRLSQKITSCSAGQTAVSWVAGTGVGICPAGALKSVDASEVLGAVVLDCSTSRAVPADVGADVRHVEILPHKFDRLSLQNALGGATTYIAERLGAGCKVIVACDDGQDISPAVVAAHFLVSRTGTEAGGGRPEPYTKEDVRSAISRVTQHCPAAHPSRGSAKQVYNWLRLANL